MTLTEFLLARISEDEAAVESYRGVSAGHWRYGGKAGRIWLEAPSSYRLLKDPDLGTHAGEHIARWDPARVLIECAAKRRIVEFRERIWRPEPAEHQSHDVTLCALAMPYIDHPDFRQEWAL